MYLGSTVGDCLQSRIERLQRLIHEASRGFSESMHLVVRNVRLISTNVVESAKGGVYVPRVRKSHNSDEVKALRAGIRCYKLAIDYWYTDTFTTDLSVALVIESQSCTSNIAGVSLRPCWFW